MHLFLLQNLPFYGTFFFFISDLSSLKPYQVLTHILFNQHIFYDDTVSAFEAAMLMENKKKQDVEIWQLEDHYTSQNWIMNTLCNKITSLYLTILDIDLANNTNVT